MSDQKESDQKESGQKKVSRRGFLKTAGALAGAAAVELSIGPSSLPQVLGQVGPTDIAQETVVSSSYTPRTRRYYLYATDGIINVPVQGYDPASYLTGPQYRQVYIYGFAKPLSDARLIGSTTALSDPFADRNWIDDATGQPIMKGKAQLPAPPIWGVKGDILEITLFNLGFLHRPDIMDPHTIHLHGVHQPTSLDGIPELSFGIPMWDGQSPVSTASYKYRMYCERPGTYMFHCHVEASEHVQFGMYGPMWIYPTQSASFSTGGKAYADFWGQTRFGQEAVILLSEMDTRWHDSIFSPALGLPDPALADFNPVEYRPNYWFINGRCFPDTVLPGKYTVGYQPGTATTGDTTLTYYPAATVSSGTGAGTYFVPRQPVQTYVQTGVGEPVLVRLINMGYQAQPMHFHGVMPMIVGKDTQAWVPVTTAGFIPMFATSTDQRKSTFTQLVASGETYDLIAMYPDKAKVSSIYSFINQTPQPNPFLPSDAAWGEILHAVDSSIPVTDATQPPAGRLFNGYPLLYLWHEHDDYKVTNDGTYPGGAVALVKVNKTPPSPKPSIISNLIPA